MKDEFVQEVIKYTLGEVNEELNRKFFDLRNKIFNSVEYSYDEYNIYGTVISKDELKIFENNACMFNWVRLIFTHRSKTTPHSKLALLPVNKIN